MTEAMNLDASDIVDPLEGFDSLDTISADFHILHQEPNENVRVVRNEDIEIMPTIMPKSHIGVKEEIINMDDEDIPDDDQEEDDDMGESINSHMVESITTDMIEGDVNEIMHNVIDLQGDEVEMQEDDVEVQEDMDDHGQSHVLQIEADDIVGHEDQHGLFSEGVIGDEEIIDDSQVITEDVSDVHPILSGQIIHADHLLGDSDVKYLDDIMNDNVNETIIEATEVEDRTGEVEVSFDCEDDDDEEEEMPVTRVPTIISTSHITDELIIPDQVTDIMMLNQNSSSPPDSKKIDISSINETPTQVFVKSLTDDLLTLKTNKVEKDDNMHILKTDVEPSLPPLTLVTKSDQQVHDAVKSITSGVYVMNSSGNATPLTQTIIQSGGTLIAPKDTDSLQKISRVMTIPNIDASSGQTIRIVAPPGKFNSPKAITLAQARQMGLLSPTGRINNIIPTTAKPVSAPSLGIGKLMVPTSRKTVTVVKSPTKILPAPPVVSHKPQKVLIRQANTLKTIVASGSTGPPPGAHMIRIPASQTIQQILPGGSKQVQYVKLVSTGGGAKGQTLVPVSLSKTIPVITTNLLNSPATTFKVVPLSTQAGSNPTGGQRVLIPASAVPASAQNPISSSQIVMLPSHLLQQVKKGDCKLVPAVNAASIPALRATTTVNGSRKLASTPVPIKKEPIAISVAATPVSVAPTITPPASASPPTPPLLIPVPVATPTTPPRSQSSPPGAEATSPTALSTSANIGVLPQPKTETKQEQWSGDESYLEANGIRPRKPCNCTKSMCLKLYCDCFANGEFCYQCNCTCCYNNLEHEEERQRAIKSCLERNPTAFRPKIGKTLAGSEERRHNRGCNCKRSGCLKNYCECFEAKIPCSKNCKCAGCKNTENYPGKRGSGDDERTRYKSDSKSCDPHPGHLYSSACRQAFGMLSPELIQATCQCLIAQAEKWDKSDGGEQSEESQKLIIQEFGHCLVQIIDCVTKSIPQQSAVSSTS